MLSDKWNDRFLEMALMVGSWSKDPGTKVGAVIVRPDKTIASLGYNGYPRKVIDPLREMPDTREIKLLKTVHAEMNAILSAREPLHGCSIFVAPLCPCASCAAAIIQSGITEVVYRMPTLRAEWAESFGVAMEMFNQAGVTTRRVVE